MLRLNNKPFGRWSLDDMSILLQDEWRESDTHDYKRDWKIDDDFKKDVCSFANHRGGIIFFGIKENKGIATELCGIDNLGEDEFELKIANSLSASIEPVKPSFSIQVIPLEENKCILAIEIKEGFYKPYCFKNDRRFFIRSNAGKVQMTYMQIEEMFLRTNSLYEQIEQFLDKRIKTLENQSNIQRANFCGKPYLAVHLIPATALLAWRKSYDLTKLPTQHSNIFQSNPFGRDCERSKMNADGFIRNYRWEDDNGVIRLRQTQVQIFWNGILEAVTTSVFGDEVERRDVKHLRACFAKKAVDELLDDAKRFYDTIELDEPVVAVISLRNVSAYQIYFEFALGLSDFEQNSIRSSNVLLDFSKADIQEDKNLFLDEFGYMLGKLDFHAQQFE